MYDVITTLKAQHVALRELIAELEAALASGETPRVAAATERFRVALYAHLELEDRKLYPSLLAAQATDVRETASRFAKSLQVIAAGVREFLGRHVGPAIDVEAFRAGWPSVRRALSLRVEEEERLLYPLHASTKPPPA